MPSAHIVPDLSAVPQLRNQRSADPARTPRGYVSDTGLYCAVLQRFCFDIIRCSHALCSQKLESRGQGESIDSEPEADFVTASEHRRELLGNVAPCSRLSSRIVEPCHAVHAVSPTVPQASRTQHERCLLWQAHNAVHQASLRREVVSVYTLRFPQGVV